MCLVTFVAQCSQSASLTTVYTTKENALANRKWKPTEWMCSVASVLMNGPTNSLFKSHFHRQPKPSLFISFDTKCSVANNKPSAVSSFNQVSNFFVENRVVEPFQWNAEYFVCSFALIYSNKAPTYISSQFYLRTIAFVICKTDFTSKMSQFIYLIIRCDATFSTVRLEIFKCTWN